MSNPRLPYIRLTVGQDDDLITWLTQLESLPYGTKGQTIKQTLRRGLGLTESSKKQTDTSSFDTGELLSDIRR